MEKGKDENGDLSDQKKAEANGNAEIFTTAL